ncbi:MAG TPA: hypothetical protein DD670_15335 [Planctomycetaceae bacterium]|nr:hypothetical protein [Planctomycetaceae bacterium]
MSHQRQPATKSAEAELGAPPSRRGTARAVVLTKLPDQTVKNKPDKTIRKANKTRRKIRNGKELAAVVHNRL